MVEIGAGAGRLVRYWLQRGLTVIAIERARRLRKHLERRFKAEVLEGRIHIRAKLPSRLPSNSAVIAPYNVAFHFRSPRAFAAMIARAIAGGARMAVFDVDDLTCADVDRAASYSRTVGAFRETVKVTSGRSLVTCMYGPRHARLIEFVVRPVPVSDLIAALRESSILARISLGPYQPTDASKAVRVTLLASSRRRDGAGPFVVSAGPAAAGSEP